jgi:antitoxin CptB
MSGTAGELDKRRKQLVYRAGHRGIKEMDIILGEFARGRIGTLDEADLDLLEVLMAENDRDLLAWFTGEAALPRRLDTPLFHAVLGFHAEKAR